VCDVVGVTQGWENHIHHRVISATTTCEWAVIVRSSRFTESRYVCVCVSLSEFVCVCVWEGVVQEYTIRKAEYLCI
jgi:hypothetical protein